MDSPSATTSPPLLEASGDRPMRALWEIAWMAAAVALLGQVGFWFSRFSSDTIIEILPQVGFSLALALACGIWRAVPATFIGALVGHALLGQTSLAALSGTIGPVCGVVLSWALLKIVAKVDLAFSSLKDFVKFFLFGCLPGPVLAGLLENVPGISHPSLAIGILADAQAGAFGSLVFCPFFLFLLRRQDFRPSGPGERLELLAYLAGLAVLVWALVQGPDFGPGAKFYMLAGVSVLALVVAVRFGLRSLSLFLAAAVFLVPAAAALVPGQMAPHGLVSAPVGFPLPSHGFAFLSALACLLVATFRDEMDSLRLKFAMAMSTASLCVWDWSSAGWAFYTPSWSEKFGIPGRKLVSDDFVRGLLHPDDLPEFDENFRRLTASEIPRWSQACRMRDDGGEWLWVQVDARAVRHTTDDRVASLAGVMRDTTSERESVQNRITAIETEAQLRALRAQINPHFLFNALNSVRALIGRQDAKAKSMITSLSSLLRELLASRDTKLHSVEKEIEIVRDYLEIEAIRFGDRLRYRLDCPPVLLSQRVPGMLVLTLVENAVKHGISKLEKGGKIDILVAHSPDFRSLLVFVINDGHLAPPGENRSPYGGQGLENTRERILLSTDGRGSFEIHEIPGPRVEAIALLPFDERYLAGDQEFAAFEKKNRRATDTPQPKISWGGGN